MENNEVRGQTGGRCAEHIGECQSEICAKAGFPRQQEDQVDHDAGHDLADGRQDAHAADHAERQGDHTLNNAHQGCAPEDGYQFCGYDEEHQ